MKKIALFISILLTYSFHDVHITHTKVYYNTDLGSIEITIKVAIEDLERTFQNQSSEKLLIGTENENILVEKLIPNYFNKNLSFLINNQTIDYKYIGKEINKNLHDIYLYFEINSIDKDTLIKSITINNTLFLNISTNQNNFVLVEYKNQNFNVTFTKDFDNKKILLIN